MDKKRPREKKHDHHHHQQQQISLLPNDNNIPSEIVFEVLLRVPCKDLVERLRFVSKQWCSIVHDPHFIDSHLDRTILIHQQSSSSSSSSNSHAEQQQQLVLVSTPDGYTFSLSSLHYHNFNMEKHLLFTAKNGSHGGIANVERINSVNGLVCFESTGGFVHVCNPVTGEIITAPRSLTLDGDGYHALGLGFCPLSKEYKVVLVHCEAGLYGPELDTLKAEVVTLGRDIHSWRTVNTPPRSLMTCPSDTVASVNGGSLLYWSVVSPIRIPKLGFTDTTLLQFDVTGERFNSVVVPVVTEEPSVAVLELKGRLSLVHFVNIPPLEDTKMEIWTFVGSNSNKEDMTNLGCWVKEHVITLERVESLPGIDYSVVLSIVGEKLVMHMQECRGPIACFDICNGRLLGVYRGDDNEDNSNKKKSDAFTAIPYLPSLVKLSAGHASNGTSAT